MTEAVLKATPAGTIRPLGTWSELDACVALQRETWGTEYADIVPRALLKVARGVGGVLLGGYEGERLVGFVFSLCGIRGGEPVHWSHMLAVRPECRNRGWARALKQGQKAAVRAQGIRWIYWTFDPLVAVNAHLNLNRLRVEADTYVRDMYGQSTSPLHAGLGTDRLIVRWDVEAPQREAPRIRPAWRKAPAVAAAEPTDGPTHELPEEPCVRLEVPEDIFAVLEGSRRSALAWRMSTRHAFESYLSLGYAVAAFYRDELSRRCFYVMRASSVEERDGS